MVGQWTDGYGYGCHGGSRLNRLEDLVQEVKCGEPLHELEAALLGKKGLLTGDGTVAPPLVELAPGHPALHQQHQIVVSVPVVLRECRRQRWCKTVEGCQKLHLAGA